jgi:segregation and condensation protein A
MKISVLTLFPELYGPFFGSSLLKRALERGDLTCDVRSLFEFCVPKERADAPTFGHGPGLLIRPEVVERLAAELPGRGPTSFRELTRTARTRIEVVVHFLGLLELYKQGLVDLDQPTTFGALVVTWTAAPDEEVDTDELTELSARARAALVDAEYGG